MLPNYTQAAAERPVSFGGDEMSKIPVTQVTLLSGVTTPSSGTGTDTSTLDQLLSEDRNFIANVSGTGAVTASVLVEVSNNNRHWMTMAAITLSGTTSASDGFVSDESWQYVRGTVSAISGTGAAVTLTMAV